MILNIAPIPKGRPRFNRFGHAYTPQRTRDFENEVAHLASFHHKKPMTGNLKLIVNFYYKRDADLDNFCKSIMDSLQGIAFENDRQIVEIDARKIKDTKNPRIVYCLIPVG